MRVLFSALVRTYMYIYMCVCVRVCVYYVYVYIYIYVCVCITYTYIYIWRVFYPCNALVTTFAKFRDNSIFCLPTLSCQLSSQQATVISVYSINWHTHWHSLAHTGTVSLPFHQCSTLIFIFPPEGPTGDAWNLPNNIARSL
jgi:hypothetical protein